MKKDFEVLKKKNNLH